MKLFKLVYGSSSALKFREILESKAFEHVGERFSGNREVKNGQILGRSSWANSQQFERKLEECLLV